MAVAYSRMKKHNHYKARLNALISALDGPLPRPTKTAYTTLRQIVQWILEGLALMLILLLALIVLRWFELLNPSIAP